MNLGFEDKTPDSLDGITDFMGKIDIFVMWYIKQVH